MRFRDTLIVSHVAIFEARLYCNLSTTGQCQLPQRYLQQTTGSINHTRIICGPSRTTDCPHELVNSQFISTFDTIDRDRHTHVCETSREEPVRATWPEIPKEPRNKGQRRSGNGPLEGKRAYQWLTINTSRTNHSIFSGDFPATRPANKKTRCITRGTRRGWFTARR